LHGCSGKCAEVERGGSEGSGACVFEGVCPGKQIGSEGVRRNIMEKPTGLLVDGKIPAKTECPFAGICKIKSNGNCKHLGEKHECEFSCASARGFNLFNHEKYTGQN
jgi:hypothetical protein